MYFWVGVIVPLSRMLENVEVATPFTYWLMKEVEEAGKTAAYSRSKRKVSKISRMISMANTQIVGLSTERVDTSVLPDNFEPEERLLLNRSGVHELRKCS